MPILLLLMLVSYAEAPRQIENAVNFLPKGTSAFYCGSYFRRNFKPFTLSLPIRHLISHDENLCSERSVVVDWRKITL